MVVPSGPVMTIEVPPVLVGTGTVIEVPAPVTVSLDGVDCGAPGRVVPVPCTPVGRSLETVLPVSEVRGAGTELGGVGATTG